MPDLNAIRERLAAYEQVAPVLAMLYFDTDDFNPANPGARLALLETAHKHYRADIKALLALLDAKGDGDGTTNP